MVLSKKSTLAAMLALVLLLPAASAAANAPYITAGDRWVFDTSTSQSTSESTASVEEVGTYTLNDEGIEAYKLVTRTSTTTSTPVGPISTTATTTSWFRAVDGALLETQTTSERGGVVVTKRYHEPCATFVWPLEVGADYVVECTYTSSSTSAAADQTATESKRVQVIAEEEQTVAAGTFATTRLTISQDDASQTHHYAPDACTTILIENEDGETTSALTEFSCEMAGEQRPNETTDGTSNGDNTTAPPDNTTTTEGNDTTPPDEPSQPPTEETSAGGNDDVDDGTPNPPEGGDDDTSTPGFTLPILIAGLAAGAFLATRRRQP